jgi:hypothetical protein
MVAVVRPAAISTEILSDATITSVARASIERRTSKTIRVDDGPETVSKMLDQRLPSKQRELGLLPDRRTNRRCFC